MQRGADGDADEALAAVERTTVVSGDLDTIHLELPLLRLRGTLARDLGNDAGYRQYVERYRLMALELGFVGHIGNPLPTMDSGRSIARGE